MHEDVVRVIIIIIIIITTATGKEQHKHTPTDPRAPQRQALSSGNNTFRVK